MILNFSVQNFSSIKDKQTLSFEADKSPHLEDYFIIKTNSGHRVSKLGLIYGANASGKTNVLLALAFLRELVLEPESKKTESLDFKPFLFDPLTPHTSSVLSIEFIQNDIRYFYEVEFNKKSILKEELINYNPSKANVFRRTTDTEKQFAEIKFGSKISVDKAYKKVLESNTLWNNTVLGGFLKTNIELKELKEVTTWFSEYLKHIIYPEIWLDEYVTYSIDSSTISKKDVVAILRKADFNISGVVINKENREMPDGFLDFLEKREAPSDYVNNIKENGKLTSLSVDIEHTIRGQKYYLPIDDESQGTQRYYGFAGLLSMLIRKPVAVLVDELESSLHPDLFTHFLLSFLMNTKNSQLVATTHNREILNNKDIFRNDSIWFTNKNETCATELYSLADFDSSVIRDTSSIYNAYKAGKLGGIPNLGDYFIDLDYAE